MRKQDVVIRFQFLEGAMHDGAFAAKMGNPRTRLSLLAGVMTHFDKRFDDIFKRVDIIVDEQQSLLIFNQFLC